ncbi:MAG: cytochrome C [Gammaproteobacteria bacterium]|nr:cytochrome C [Gammaproteobacteria bacterium]
MNRNRKMMLASMATTLAAGVLIVTGTVQAKPPRSEAQVAQEQAALMQAVAKGDGLWHDGSLGTNGLACGNCHPDGSASNPHTFPKFQTNLGKVGTLREMINWCIMVPMQGKALALDSEEMIAMEAYSTFTHRGVAIAPAKDEQYGAVPVVSGPGYPSQ